MKYRIFLSLAFLLNFIGISAQKKVVIISSSPRAGGNTELLCQEFERGAKESGNQVEMIRLRDYKIDFINEKDVELGMTGEKNEEVRDDAPSIIKKMSDADVIVLSSPVYFMNISGEMKTLMDRTFASEGNLAEKQFYFITACTDDSESTADCAINGFRGFTMCLPQSDEKGMVKAYGMREKGDVKGSKYLQQAYELGKGVK